MNRRTALKTLAAGASLPLLGARTLAAADSGSRRTFTLGIASISLKSLPLDNMLATVKRLGLDSISLHRAHSPWENQPGQWQEIANAVRAAGVSPLCCGVLYMKNDEPAMRRLMDYAKTLDVRIFSCSPEPAALPLLNRLVQEYDLRAAIHNHGPEDKSWPSVEGLMTAVASLDPRVGLCLDIGHCYRGGEEPAEIIRRHSARLYDVHLKDSAAEVGALRDIPVEMGRGKLDLHGIFAALKSVDYRHGAWFEYEKDPSDPVPGLAESIGYVRGLVRGMG
ncbi:MAG TPA: sugar phosphate isomerase/epimerase [Lacunisphaera sp.]|nr:sugar phosphate isomerase/epimerase [Lacunisphaera sp.]